MPETKSVFIPTRNEYEQILKDTVDSILTRRIPEILRRADRKPYLTTKDLKDLYGISYRMQKYYRDECNLPFVQEGKKIIYDTVEFEHFLDGRKTKI